MSRQLSLEQKRAEAAWQAVEEIKESKSEYLSLARSAPASIQINGLGQTLSFWLAKDQKEHKSLYKNVSGWVMSRLNIENPNGKSDRLMEWIVKEATSQQYRWATTETIAYLNWIKRFAEAKLG